MNYSVVPEYSFTTVTNNSKFTLNMAFSMTNWIISCIGVTSWNILRLFLLKSPSFVLKMLNKFQVTLFFLSLIVITIFLFLFFYHMIRNQFMHSYSQSNHDEDDEILLKNREMIRDIEAMFMKDRELRHKSGFTSYLDEFLTAIKIFGYLEKPVFHELTKSMRTQRLKENEIMLLDDSSGFAIVVEGDLQIFHKVNSKDTSGINTETFLEIDAMNNENENENEEFPINNGLSNSGYIINGVKFQLLNNIKSGNPISSLVNILRLFTYNDRENLDASQFSSNLPTNSSPYRVSSYLDSTMDHHNSNFSVDKDVHEEKDKLSLESSSLNHDDNPFFPPLHSSPSHSYCSKASFVPPQSELPDIIAKASTNCTIAVIPSSAFKRLMIKYPRSASHIIQMILTKLCRVTFQTAHSYLGLTKEIMHTEIVLNKSIKFDLPIYLKEAIVRKIKEDNSVSDLPLKLSTKSSSMNINSQPSSSTSPKGSRHVFINSRNRFNPGDLLSNVPLSRKDVSKSNNINSHEFYESHNIENASGSTITLDSLTRLPTIPSPVNTGFFSSNNLEDEIKCRSFSSSKEETEESSWRMALVENMFGYLGITEDSIFPHNDDSTESSLSFSYGSSASLTSPHRHSQEMFRCLNLDQLLNKQVPKQEQFRDSEIPNALNFDAIKEEFAQGIEIMLIPKGTIFVEQGKDPKGLFYNVSGILEVIGKNGKDDRDIVLYSVNPGGIAGYLTALIGYKSFVSLRAKTDLYVGFLSSEVLERLYDKYFMIYLRIAESLTSLLSEKILKLDYALEWINLEASETLFNQDDIANAIYVVLNGRLRQFHEIKDSTVHDILNLNKKKRLKRMSPTYKNNVQVLGEYGQGESFGEVEVLTAINRASTVVAVRDTELARIPRALFEVLALEHPSIMIRVTRLVARKILQQQQVPTENNYFTNMNNNNRYSYDVNSRMDFAKTNITAGQLLKSNHNGTANYKTITVLPITQGLPVEEFSMKLIHAFKQVNKSTIGLNQRTTLSHLGRHAFDKLAKLKQSGYFTDLEELYEIVVYIADTPVNSSWTSTCIAQGDCILLLADAASDPDIGEYERLLLKGHTTARTELILLHQERYVEPGLTSRWLRNRIWVHSHHHIQFVSARLGLDNDTSKVSEGFMHRLKHKESINKLTKIGQENFARLLPDSIKNTVESISMKYMNKKPKYYTPTHSHKNDFLKLARILSGQAIGLVLGGGGARGISHLGILKSIEERGIPVDIIGGTSIGSFIGGLYAKDYDIVPIYGRVKSFVSRIGSLWRVLGDLTWPVTAYTTGHEFNRSIWKSFRDIRIEDFWIQYYCNSTNITDSVQEIHTSGYAWKYIRASMSLAGLLPPINDNGSMLLDGGYVDNLTVSEMKSRGCNTILAVDVGSITDKTPMTYGDSLNGFWQLFNRWNPFSKQPNAPGMAEIQMRLGYVASVNALEKAKSTPGVIYMRPPIDNYATLDFSKFEEIYDLGVEYGRNFFKSLDDSDSMPKIPGARDYHVDQSMPFLHRRNSI